MKTFLFIVLDFPQQELIERYKELIRKDGNENELYKWELVKQFQVAWAESQDIVQVLSNIDFTNLLDWRPAIFIKTTKDHPKDTEAVFSVLFNEEAPLSDRINQFYEETGELSRMKYENTDKDVVTERQDERCMSVYLTCRYPEKYSIFKNSFYQEYCQLIGVQTKPARQKYIHYLQLIDDLIDQFISQDEELLELSASTLNEDCYQDPKHRLLAQDILFRTLEQKQDEDTDAVVDPVLVKFKKWLYDDWVKRDTKLFLRFLATEQQDSEEYVTSEALIKRSQEYNKSPGERMGNISIMFSHLVTKEGQNISKRHKPLQNVIEYKPPNAQSGMPKTHYRIIPKYVEAVSRLIDEYFATHHPNSFTSSDVMTTPSGQKIPLNQILYGPPGTGKTYGTLAKAIQILDEDFYADHHDDRTLLKERFDQLQGEGRLVFVTFHQSYGYEEFVEGVRVETADDNTVLYQVKPGAFRAICENARKSDTDKKIEHDFDRIIEVLKEDAVDPIGWQTKTGKKFQFIYPGKKVFEIFPDSSHLDIAHDHGRPASIENIRAEYLNGEVSTYNPAYTWAIIDYLQKEKGLKPNTDGVAHGDAKPYLIIIDEINRGNISKIFGELITLLEDSKRVGEEDELQVQLPYSGESFGVPQNLYVLGTMNSADRSIALLDTALRRRFHFEEMMPRPDTLPDNIEGVDLQALLTTLNKRIEYLYDRDHCIGHAYFINCKTFEDIQEVMLNQVLPLLQEYFYDDMEKIRMVFGRNKFIIPQEDISFERLFGSNFEGNLDSEKTLYRINVEAFGDAENYRTIYETVSTDEEA